MARSRDRGEPGGARQQLVLKMHTETDMVVKIHLDITSTEQQYIE